MEGSSARAIGSHRSAVRANRVSAAQLGVRAAERREPLSVQIFVHDIVYSGFVLDFIPFLVRSPFRPKPSLLSPTPAVFVTITTTFKRITIIFVVNIIFQYPSNLSFFLPYSLSNTPFTVTIPAIGLKHHHHHH